MRNKLNRTVKRRENHFFKKRPFQGFIIQQGHAADILITDGNTGPSGATPAHLLCHDARAYLKPRQIQADRKTVTIWRKNCPLGETVSLLFQF